MPIYYDVEIIGGINVTGEVNAEDGYIDGFTLPDGTRIDVDRSGYCYGKLPVAISRMILEKITDCASIMEAVERTRPYVRPDTAPIRINAMVG